MIGIFLLYKENPSNLLGLTLLALKAGISITIFFDVDIKYKNYNFSFLIHNKRDRQLKIKIINTNKGENITIYPLINVAKTRIILLKM